MSKTNTSARIRSDGTVVEILDDGSERPLPKTPMRPMTEEEVAVAAAADPDARPMTPEQMRTVRRVPRVKTLRRALGTTQEQFATRYHIPLGTLRDWEQGRTEPDQPARAYLRAIAGDPDGVFRRLENSPSMSVSRATHRSEGRRSSGGVEVGADFTTSRITPAFGGGLSAVLDLEFWTRCWPPCETRTVSAVASFS